MTIYRARPITDDEARAIFRMSSFPGASTVTMDANGRALATSMFYYLEMNGGAAMWWVGFINPIGGDGGQLVETAHDIVEAFKGSGAAKSQAFRNYAEIFAEHGQVMISGGMMRFRDIYEAWQNGEWTTE